MQVQSCDVHRLELPHQLSRYEDTPEPTVAPLVQLADDPKLAAICETGLDYFRLSGDLKWQRERFRTYIGVLPRCGGEAGEQGVCENDGPQLTFSTD